MKKTKVFFVALALFANVGLAAAEEPIQVLSDQYVVEYNQLLAAQKDANPNYQILEKVDSRRSVIGLGQTPSFLSGQTAEEVVDYSAAEDKCPEILSQNPEIKYCSPNYIYTINLTPNDSDFGNMWGLSNAQGIRAEAAWDTTTGSDEVVIAVIDSGIDYNHPDLRKNMWVNPGEIPGNRIDDDNNGYVDDIHGISGLNNSGNPIDENGHGTHVAGTIGAASNNARGVSGINWNVKIMGLKFLGANGGGSLSAAIKVLDYLTLMKQRGINVVASNNSWGGRGYSDVLRSAIAESVNAGVLFVAAAGNEAQNNDNASVASYPGSYDLAGIVSVAAIDQSQNIASFSNYGQQAVDIAAPGVGIRSTYLNNSYRNLSGTSMAAPHVTGAIGLLASVASGSVSELKARLLESAVTYPTLVGQVYSERKLDLYNLINNIRTPLTNPVGPGNLCRYVISETDQGRDAALAASDVVLRGDEGAFATVDLPFAFPFYERTVNKLNVSLNGVIYFGQTHFNDYKNTSAAKSNSLSVLQTDLKSDASADGIRVLKTSQYVAISWTAKHFSHQTAESILVQVRLYPDGTVKQFLNFPDQSVLGTVETKSTIGIRGEKEGELNTFAFNGSADLSLELGLNYQLICQNNGQPAAPGKVQPAPGLTISNVSISTINRSGRRISKISPKKTVNLGFSGSGTGQFNYQLSLDGRTCVEPHTAILNAGRGQKTFQAQKFLRKYRSLGVSAGGVQTKMKIKGNKTLKLRYKLLKASKRKQRYLKKLNRDCARLAVTLN